MHANEDVFTAGSVASSIRLKPWGGSTDFNELMRMMLKLARSKYPNGTTRRQVLMVFTDMQFDCADCARTNYELVEQEFAQARMPMPLIVFWNIRGDTTGNSLPVKAGKRDVVCLSGYSADLMQDFFAMLGSGQFAPANGPAENEFLEASGKDVLSTESIIRLVETSPMYMRYVGPKADCSLHEKRSRHVYCPQGEVGL
jgi:hypothetical protein